jgi:hypothetical protein
LRYLAIDLAVLATVALVAYGQGGGGGGGRGRGGGDRPPRPGGGGARLQALPADMAPQAALSVVPGRPTDRAVSLSILSDTALEGYVEYGSTLGDYASKTAVTTLAANVPVVITLTDLQPDAGYLYRLRTRASGATALGTGEGRAFHTARAPGSTFTVEMQGDSHPERPQMFDAALYEQTLRAAAADHPDFYLTIGDDFSVDTMQPATADGTARMYRYQRPFLSLLNAPVFLVNGNHEQAARCNLDGTDNNVAVWAGTNRTRYFALPTPDAFYSGDDQSVPRIGLLSDYYAWTWGDALFAVIDPYWHSAQPVDNPYGGGQKTRDTWESTLGEAQYRWLEKTLTTSRAKYKFVFTHHVLGTGRGGTDEAGLFEWGGHNKRGDWEFDQRRPLWPRPIHQLMAQTGVTIFFQGHDHIFVKQQLDGVVYQSLPLPADAGYQWFNREAYGSGDALPNAGRVRLTVAPDKVRVEYVRSWLPRDETAGHKNGEVAYSYEVPARR